MSQKKILFFIIVGIVVISLIAGILYVSNYKKVNNDVPKSIKIWINDGTTESYKSLIDGFKEFAPEYKKMDIVIEKQSSDPDRYRTLLYSTLTEGNGPDIFMLHSGEDSILETKVEPIPSDFLNFSDFDKRYDDIFRDLLITIGSGKDKKTALKGVPLGYETLGVFYNKSLIRSVPKTWTELDSLYRESTDSKYPSNLGLSPTYTPNMVDILPIWLYENGVETYRDMSNGREGLITYLDYADMPTNTQNSNEGSDGSSTKTLSGEKVSMYEDKLSTLDLFIRGNIGMVIGYPSLVLELEKSSKRAGVKSSSNVILTERLPQMSTQKNKNIGRYAYFGISKLTSNPKASLKFIEYLMTSEAERLYLKEYQYVVPAQIEFYDAADANSLSDNFNRAKLTSFIPGKGEKVIVFQYGLKSEFERYLKEGIDVTGITDVESINKKISGGISCDIDISLGLVKSGDCTIE